MASCLLCLWLLLALPELLQPQVLQVPPRARALVWLIQVQALLARVQRQVQRFCQNKRPSGPMGLLRRAARFR